MNFIIPFVSLALKVDYIEKHVTLNRSEKGVDYYSSIEPSDLNKFINKSKIIKSSFGQHILSFSKNEKKYRSEVKKIWYSKKEIKKNGVVKKECLTMKRPPVGKLAPVFIENIENYKTKEKIKIEDPILNSKINTKITAVIVARLKSKRLPGKALKKINNETLIDHLIKRLKLSKKVNRCISDYKK